MTSYRHITVCLLFCLSLSCGRQQKTDGFIPQTFPLPNVPSMLEQPDRLDYILSHYWDAFTSTDRDFPCDSSYVSGVPVEDVEQAFSTYIMLMQQVPLEQAQGCMKALVGRMQAVEQADTASNVFEALGTIIEHYLYDPNSPVRDEDIFHAYAKAMADCPLLPRLQRDEYARQAELTALNSRGTRAADFRFSYRNGRVGSLYGIKADYTLLFFSNPGCTACKDIIDLLCSSSALDSLIEEKRLAIVNVYIDESLDEWYSYMPYYPDNWVNVFDHNHIIRDDMLYNVRAIPSLYLLDSDKTVILKDCTDQMLIATLESLLF